MMRNIFGIFLVSMVLITAVAGCIGNNDGTAGGTNETTNNTEIKNSADGKILIVYYSRTGNTETIADQIYETVGGDRVKIETVTLYPEEYSDVTAQAQKELNEAYLPPITNRIENLDEYDTVFFGYPIWWGTIPPAMMTFLSENDLSGKTVIPFCTHGGSGQAQSLEAIREYSPNATISENLVVRGSDVSSSQEVIAAWLERLGYNSSSEGIKVRITTGNETLTATFIDNPASRALIERFPLTLPMEDLYFREMYCSLQEELPAPDAGRRGYGVGEIAYWTPGRGVVIFYEQNGEVISGLQSIGRIDSGVEIFKETGNTEVTFELIE